LILLNILDNIIKTSKSNKITKEMNVFDLLGYVVSLKPKCTNHPISVLGDSNCLYCHDGNRLLDPVLKFMNTNFGRSTSLDVLPVQKHVLLIMTCDCDCEHSSVKWDNCQYCDPQGNYTELFPFINSVVEKLMAANNDDKQKILETFASLMEVMKSIEPSAEAVYTFLTKHLFAYTYFCGPNTSDNFPNVDLLLEKISGSGTFEKDFTTFEEALLKKISGKKIFIK
jgi:hypothetical protein